MDEDGDFSTPLIPRTKACAYVIYDEKGVTKCGIEKAFEADNIPKFEGKVILPV